MLVARPSWFLNRVEDRVPARHGTVVATGPSLFGRAAREVRGKLLDLSSGGLRFVADGTLDACTPIDLRLDHPAIHRRNGLVLPATVRWCQGRERGGGAGGEAFARGRIGCAFRTLSAGERLALETILRHEAGREVRHDGELEGFLREEPGIGRQGGYRVFDSGFRQVAVIACQAAILSTARRRQGLATEESEHDDLDAALAWSLEVEGPFDIGPDPEDERDRTP